MSHDSLVVEVDDLFPAWTTGDTSPGIARPFGLTVAIPVLPAETDVEPVMTYSQRRQVSVVNGLPAVEHPETHRLVMKKADTWHDHQRFDDEVKG